MVSVESHGLRTLLAVPMTSSAELRMTCEKRIQDSSEPLCETAVFAMFILSTANFCPMLIL